MCVCPLTPYTTWKSTRRGGETASMNDKDREEGQWKRGMGIGSGMKGSKPKSV